MQMQPAKARRSGWHACIALQARCTISCSLIIGKWVFSMLTTNKGPWYALSHQRAILQHTLVLVRLHERSSWPSSML